jgi:D-alanyl-D-alanine carboxypeptidase
LASHQSHILSRPRLRDILVALLLAIVLVHPSVSAARSYGGMENLRRFAGIVVDAKSGQVLYQQNADDARYPASITKVMTLYILFQELNAGHLKLTSMLNVSAFSASASPTKLGLRAGSQIAVQDAIKSIVTISANDMARTIAENISGNEDAFARRMTATAHALGMKNTTYFNASGLPDGRQRTTVRDQAILAQAVYEHFPQYYSYFQTQSFTYGRRVYGNHDNVLGFMGVDGLKTGYINAAGYNLMTASRAGNRHLVVIAFGFNTGGQRDATVRSLVQKYLPRARQGQYIASIPMPGRIGKAPTMLASVAPAVIKPVPMAARDDQAMPEPVAYAPEPAAPPAHLVASTGGSVTPMDIGVKPATDALAAIGVPSSRQTGARPDVVGQSLNNMLLGAPPTSLGQTRGSAPLVPPVGIGAHNEPIDLMTSGSVSSRQVADAALAVEAGVLRNKAAPTPPAALADAAAPKPGSWIVQIGAAPTQDGANSLLSAASSKVTNLADLRPYVERFDKNGQTFYRARFIGFGSRDEASGACDSLKKAKMTCLAMQS